MAPNISAGAYRRKKVLGGAGVWKTAVIHCCQMSIFIKTFLPDVNFRRSLTLRVCCFIAALSPYIWVEEELFSVADTNGILDTGGESNLSDALIN